MNAAEIAAKLANVITNAIIAESGEDPITLPDSLKIAWLDQGETDMGVVAQAAITALWPLFVERAAARLERGDVFSGPNAVAHAIQGAAASWDRSNSHDNA